MGTASWNRVEVDLAALRHNFRALRQLVGARVEILAVVKADAYGHGLVAAAQAFAEAGAKVFGVAEVEEGIRLREAGISGQIVVLLGTDRHGVADALAYDLSPVVYDLETVKDLAARARKAGRRIGLHVKVDLGMGRLGIRPEEFPRFMAALSDCPELYLAGVMTHLPKADIEDDGLAGEQQHQLFLKLLDDLPPAAAGGWDRHLANSAALLRYPEMRSSMVRPGITLYGCSPAAWLRTEDSLDLRPAMSFKTRVIQVKDIPVGQGISYGHLYVTDRPTRLAILPVGYANGYLRRLTGKAEVLLGGKRAPIRGMICMNACMADITGIPSVAAGDEVVLLGRQGNEEIRADEIARWSSTIDYEILCLFGSCNRQLRMDSDKRQTPSMA